MRSGVSSSYRLRTDHLVVGHSGPGDDRAAVMVGEERTLIVVADGAGGTRNGALAAETVLQRVCAVGPGERFDPVELLRSCDAAIHAGNLGAETTAVVAIVDDAHIIGASVGDSAAWLVGPTESLELTRHQLRKPLIGRGNAAPVPFSCDAWDSTLVVASDGLWKYSHPVQVRRAVDAEFRTLAARLVDLVRLKSGGLQDDVAIVVCRQG